MLKRIKTFFNWKVTVFKNLDPDLICKEGFVLHHHLGLGDVICLYGLVAELHKLYPNTQIHIPVKKAYLNSANFLYKHLNGKYKIFIVDFHEMDDELTQVESYALKNHLNILRIGFDSLSLPFHYEMFFNQIQVNPQVSWDNFPQLMDHPDAINLFDKLSGHDDYRLIVNQNSDGSFALKGIAENDPRNIILHITDSEIGIFSWIAIMKKAREIHSVGTAAFHLIDHLELNTDTELYFHNVRHDIHTVTPRHDWKVIEY